MCCIVPKILYICVVKVKIQQMVNNKTSNWQPHKKYSHEIFKKLKP